jgi:hypothetical protein
MAKARMIAGVLGIAVRAPHGFTPPPQLKGAAGGLLERIVGAVARRRETHNFDGGDKQRQRLVISNHETRNPVRPRLHSITGGEI